MSTFNQNLTILLAPIASDMQASDAVIRQSLSSEVVLINQIADYIIGAGGKRLRPALVLLSAQAHGYNGTQHHRLAAIVEFIHTATLLHDDVVDESNLRRGRETANAAFGNAASVLVGDFLYSRAFQMMVEVSAAVATEMKTSANSLQIMHILADATNVIAQGEVMQLINMHDPQVSQAQYLHVIESKTAKLFEASAALGALLAGHSESMVAYAATYGRELGTAFQIIDDVLDYSGNASEIGKNVGDDLREGKPTLPLIYLLTHGTPAQSALAKRVIEEGGLNDLEAVVQAVNQSGALAYGKQLARARAHLACAALADLPESAAKTSLLQMAHFAVERSA